MRRAMGGRRVEVGQVGMAIGGTLGRDSDVVAQAAGRRAGGCTPGDRQFRTCHGRPCNDGCKGETATTGIPTHKDAKVVDALPAYLGTSSFHLQIFSRHIFLARRYRLVIG